MKLFTITFILAFGFSAFAGTWATLENRNTVYTKKEVCENVSGGTCYDFSTKDYRHYDEVTSSVDDLSKPLFKERYKENSCADAVDCGEKIDALNLPDGDFSSYCDQGAEDYITFTENEILPGFSYYCTGVIGYEQKVQKTLVLNTSKKNAADAEDTAKAVKEGALKIISKNITFGKNLKKEIALINTLRNLTEAQVRTFVDNFESINRLLDAGAIKTAKNSIEGLTPDEDLLREADKTKILNLINEYLVANPQ